MLFARAISNGAKWYTPGIFGGAPVYTPDEFGLEVDSDGDVVVEVIEAPAAGPDMFDGPDIGLASPVSLDPPTEPSSAIPASWNDAIIKAGLSENEFSVKGALAKCDTQPKNTDAAVAWMRLYRGWRDVGVNSDPAAKKANAGEVPG